MTYQIVFSDKAAEQFSKLERETQQRIIAVLERVRFRPEIHLRKLVGEAGYRLRVGDYRLIVDVYEKELVILVIKIGRRENIYK